MWDTKAMTCHIPNKRIKAFQATVPRFLRASGPATEQDGITAPSEKDEISELATPAVRPVLNRDLGRFLGLVVSTMRTI